MRIFANKTRSTFELFKKGRYAFELFKKDRYTYRVLGIWEASVVTPLTFNSVTMTFNSVDMTFS